MDRRKAKPGEVIINIHTGEVQKACGVFEDGSVIVGDNQYSFFSTMNRDLYWYEHDYLVIPGADSSWLGI